jgi:hypothetical protein
MSQSVNTELARPETILLESSLFKETRRSRGEGQDRIKQNKTKQNKAKQDIKNKTNAARDKRTGMWCDEGHPELYILSQEYRSNRASSVEIRNEQVLEGYSNGLLSIYLLIDLFLYALTCDAREK